MARPQVKPVGNPHPTKTNTDVMGTSLLDVLWAPLFIVALAVGMIFFMYFV